MKYAECGDFTGKRILLAAENDTGRKRLARYLVSQQYIVEDAGCGEQVISCLKSDVFDLCILDYGLPGTSFQGIVEYLDRIFCFTPIVVMVSNSKCAHTHDVAVAAPIYLLVKPFALSDFGSVVSSIVGRAGITVTTRFHRSLQNE